MLSSKQKSILSKTTPRLAIVQRWGLRPRQIGLKSIRGKMTFGITPELLSPIYTSMTRPNQTQIALEAAEDALFELELELELLANDDDGPDYPEVIDFSDEPDDGP